jgi:hypothetical protein
MHGFIYSGEMSTQTNTNNHFMNKKKVVHPEKQKKLK